MRGVECNRYPCIPSDKIRNHTELIGEKVDNDEEVLPIIVYNEAQI